MPDEIVKNEKVFKIKRMSDGLFSTGGGFPTFTKRGKVWRMRGHVTSHLNQVRKNVYDGCHIIEYEMTPYVVDSIPVSEYIVQIAERREEAEVARQEARKKRAAEDPERVEYERLKQRFEGK